MGNVKKAKPIRVLIVEDSEDDAQLEILELRKNGYAPEFQRVETAAAMKAALGKQKWDIVITDHRMPHLTSFQSVQKLKESGIDLPIIVVSGSIGEQTAVELMKAGAHDYVMKDNLKRLVPAIERELKEAQVRRERREAQAEREKLVQKLEATVKELEAFAYTISHDLRGPLHTVRSFVEALGADLERGQKDRVNEDTRAIRSGIERAEHLLKNILQYARAGKAVQPTGNVLFGDIVREALEQLAAQISAVGATVSTPEHFPTVYADQMRMVEALANIIENSINYRDRRRPLTIEIGHRSSNGEIVFFVRDNGSGIDPAKREKIFELFYRGDKESKGMGTGLAIIKRIIEGHGGRIWAEGEPGQGATICFTLPVAQAADAHGG